VLIDYVPPPFFPGNALGGRSPFPAFSQAHSLPPADSAAIARLPTYCAVPLFAACLPSPIPAGRSFPQRPPSCKVRCAIHCASPSPSQHYASLLRLQGRALRVLAPSAALPPKNRWRDSLTLANRRRLRICSAYGR
jgi:hypothetical protein